MLRGGVVQYDTAGEGRSQNHSQASVGKQPWPGLKPGFGQWLPNADDLNKQSWGIV